MILVFVVEPVWTDFPDVFPERGFQFTVQRHGRYSKLSHETLLLGKSRRQSGLATCDDQLFGNLIDLVGCTWLAANRTRPDSSLLQGGSGKARLIERN
jgi:hypothetical protein